MHTIQNRLTAFAFFLAMLTPAFAVGHPLKLSASLVEYDPNEKTLRMECKVFIDDFERSLSNSVLKGVDLATLKRDSKPRIIEEYFGKFYQITVNGKKMPLKYKVATPLHRHNVLVIEFEKAKIPLKRGDTVQIKNSIMFRDFGSAQTNRIIVRMPSFDIDEGHAATVQNYKFSHIIGEPK